VQGQLVYTRALYGRLSIITLLNGFAKIRQYVTNEPDDFVSRQLWSLLQNFQH
jgi:hypothetical protein